MSAPFVAEIRIFGFNFAPTGWAICAGQLLPISQNTALFSLLGTNFGGDGKSTFGLPNLQGNVPIHAGSSGGPGLTQYFVGETGGVQTVTLLTSEIPAHSHAFNADKGPASSASPQGNFYEQGSFPGNPGGAVWSYGLATSQPGIINPGTISLTGGNQPHNNMMPYLTLTFCIALQGIFPPRC
jgi:microcystin-dependent protein